MMIINFFSTKRNVLVSSILLVILLVGLRVAIGGFNFSYFVVAGSDFADSEAAHPNLIINEGQGYDGQFFYRYAHYPLEFEKTAYGVTVDHIEYRIQRIVYPATVWLFSVGGKKEWIPFLLVLFNVLAFIGIIVFALKICEIYGSKLSLALLPIFSFGAYMALARDTSELFEVFFFTVAVFAMIKDKIGLYFIFVVLSIFSRETSLVVIGPLSLLYGIKLLKTEGKINSKLIFKGLVLIFPLLLIMLWKYYLHITINSKVLVDGSQNLSWPFVGILYGAKNNFNFNDYKSIFETLFWYLFFVWNIVFAISVIKAINFKQLFSFEVVSMLSIVYLFWTAFSLILGPAIYVDDWGFVRIFTLWNMLGFLILMINNKSINRIKLLYSISILFLLIVRLIIRV